ncbi:hypothetical protein BDY17DRAFT_293541 [Neohortaea acidophila]|uniref:Uncharacterized protein n=1 Tax=Neohortaea acidophila TaxID=245834 RepID=A0A6A6PYX5_9PEZI|nr:uncharacterized protein BDY17DRAFT_293541 [Neohortaea acidophila]KAF2485408.1 hypothetical protein BDY17DRAFT_293541 [Neohortaea acidophila]
MRSSKRAFVGPSASRHRRPPRSSNLATSPHSSSCPLELPPMPNAAFTMPKAGPWPHGQPAMTPTRAATQAADLEEGTCGRPFRPWAHKSSVDSQESSPSRLAHAARIPTTSTCLSGLSVCGGSDSEWRMRSGNQHTASPAC